MTALDSPALTVNPVGEPGGSFLRHPPSNEVVSQIVVRNFRTRRNMAASGREI
jgi:hypothetical protein